MDSKFTAKNHWGKGYSQSLRITPQNLLSNYKGGEVPHNGEIWQNCPNQVITPVITTNRKNGQESLYVTQFNTVLPMWYPCQESSACI